jgi:hypothetical protein
MYLDYPTPVLLQVIRDVEGYGLIDLRRIEKLVLSHLRGELFRLPQSDDEEGHVNDVLHQLLKNLKLRRMREVLPEELQRAEKKKPSYSDFLARVLGEEYQHQQMRFLE